MSNQTENTGKQLPKQVRNIPDAEADLLDVAKEVNAEWIAHPQLKLTWITQEEYSEIVSKFSDILLERREVGGVRHPVTIKLENLDNEIDTNIQHIKNYLAEKFGKKTAASYYKRFGIVKIGKVYKLPIDRDERKTALELLVKSIPAFGFQDKIFGINYWTNIFSTYKQLMEEAGSIDSKVSDDVSAKNLLKEKIRKTLNSLIFLIKANYPDTYKSVLRTWGFQKEKY